MLKKVNLITKRFLQVFLYLFEVLGISWLITFLSNKSIPCTNWFEWIERITVVYALYQMIVIGILTQLNDVKKDEYLAITTLYKCLAEYSQSNNKFLKEELINNSKEELKTDMINDNDVRKDYQDVFKSLKENKKINTNYINCKIIHYEHEQEYALLNWKFSILLRIFK